MTKIPRSQCGGCKKHHRKSFDCGTQEPRLLGMDETPAESQESFGSGFHEWEGDRRDDLYGDTVRGNEIYDVEAGTTDGFIKHSMPKKNRPVELWDYHGLPEYGDEHFYSASEVAQIAKKSRRQVQRLARRYKWRYRQLKSSTQDREYWLYDLVATILSETISESEGYLDTQMLLEARERAPEGLDGRDRYVEPRTTNLSDDWISVSELVGLTGKSSGHIKMIAKDQEWRIRVDDVYKTSDYWFDDVKPWVREVMGWALRFGPSVDDRDTRFRYLSGGPLGPHSSME